MSHCLPAMCRSQHRWAAWTHHTVDVSTTAPPWSDGSGPRATAKYTDSRPGQCEVATIPQAPPFFPRSYGFMLSPTSGSPIPTRTTTTRKPERRQSGPTRSPLPPPSLSQLRVLSPPTLLQLPEPLGHDFPFRQANSCRPCQSDHPPEFSLKLPRRPMGFQRHESRTVTGRSNPKSIDSQLTQRNSSRSLSFHRSGTGRNPLGGVLDALQYPLGPASCARSWLA